MAKVKYIMMSCMVYGLEHLMHVKRVLEVVREATFTI